MSDVLFLKVSDVLRKSVEKKSADMFGCLFDPTDSQWDLSPGGGTGGKEGGSTRGREHRREGGREYRRQRGGP